MLQNQIKLKIHISVWYHYLFDSFDFIEKKTKFISIWFDQKRPIFETLVLCIESSRREKRFFLSSNRDWWWRGNRFDFFISLPSKIKIDLVMNWIRFSHTILFIPDLHNRSYFSSPILLALIEKSIRRHMFERNKLAQVQIEAVLAPKRDFYGSREKKISKTLPNRFHKHRRWKSNS